jgi:hypothetical protein
MFMDFKFQEMPSVSCDREVSRAVALLWGRSVIALSLVSSSSVFCCMHAFRRVTLLLYRYLYGKINSFDTRYVVFLLLQ